MYRRPSSLSPNFTLPPAPLVTTVTMPSLLVTPSCAAALPPVCAFSVSPAPSLLSASPSASTAAVACVRMRRASSAFTTSAPLSVMSMVLVVSLPSAISAFVVRFATAMARLPAPLVSFAPEPEMAWVVMMCRSAMASRSNFTFSLPRALSIISLVMATVDSFSRLRSSLSRYSVKPDSWILAARGS